MPTDPAVNRSLERILANTEQSISMIREHDARLVRLEVSDKLHARMEEFIDQSRDDRARIHGKLESIAEKMGQFDRDLKGFEASLKELRGEIEEYTLDRARLMGGWKTAGLIAAVLSFVAGMSAALVKVFESLNKRP